MVWGMLGWLLGWQGWTSSAFCGTTSLQGRMSGACLHGDAHSRVCAVADWVVLPPPARWSRLMRAGGSGWPVGLSRPLADTGTLLRYAMGESACAVAGPRPELVLREFASHSTPCPWHQCMRLRQEEASWPSYPVRPPAWRFCASSGESCKTLAGAPCPAGPPHTMKFSEPC